MISALLFLTLKHEPPVRDWFTAPTVTFQVQYPGNPYDLTENDVRVRFIGDKGLQFERLAYYDRGTYRADLTAPQGGKFKPVLLRNGVVQDVPCEDVEIDLKRTDHGFIHPDPQNKNRFCYYDGTPFYPLGFGLYNQGSADNIAKMGASGVNWTRIGATPSEGKNPWWPPTPGAEILPGELWDSALLSWQKLADACDSAGVNFQMVLFDHAGLDADWKSNPWNSANAGFLSSAAGFFTDPEAKRREKLWIREAIARFSSSPHLFAWELIDDTDAAPETTAWLKEMADFVRSIDPYKHPVTAGSSQDVWSDLDFRTIHGVTWSSAAKPTIAVDTRSADGLSGSIASMLFSAAPGVTVSWDIADIEKRSLYDMFKAVAKVLEVSNLPKRPTARVLTLTSTAGVSVAGIGESDWMILRTVGPNGPATIGGISLSDGDYELTEVDPKNGDTMDRTVHISNFTLRDFPLTGPSDYFIFKRKA